MKDKQEEQLPLKGDSVSSPSQGQQLKASEDLYKQKMKILVVVTSYFCVSMGMVFLNKILLTEGSSIPAPLFVTWYQCIITAAIVGALGEMGKGAPKGSFFAQFPPFEFDLEISKRVMPLSIIFVMMISLNNLCLQYVEVGSVLFFGPPSGDYANPPPLRSRFIKSPAGSRRYSTLS